MRAKKLTEKELKRFTRGMDLAVKALRNDFQLTMDRFAVSFWLLDMGFGTNSAWPLWHFAARHPVRAFRVWRALRKQAELGDK